MSLQPLLRLPLRQAVRQFSSSSRRIHLFTTRPNLRPTRPTPIQNALHQRRFKGTFKENAIKLFKDSPISVTLATLIILFGAGCMVYVNYVYSEYIIKPYHNYPEEVAKKLRRAIYYHKIDVQPKDAIKYYRQALEVAKELGMEEFGDEVMGVKIQVAFLMEQINQFDKAIEVLERIRIDNLKYLELAKDRDDLKKARTRVLSKTIQICIKLGELYGSPEVWDRDLAQERLVWAIETSMKERLRRQTQKVNEEEEGSWFSNEEMGASLESLAHSYEAKNQHYLATPLFLQALSLYPSKDCHSVVLMNNLASSLAQQSPRAAREVQAYADSRNINEQPAGPPATRETMIENAKTWAQKALNVAAVIKPPERNEECDVGCAVALHNLGEFAEMSRDVTGAKQKYEEAVSLARAIGFQEGVEQSSARLRALNTGLR